MKTGLAPLAVCVALLISSASAGGYKTGVSKTSQGTMDSADSYLDEYDANQSNRYDFKYVNNDDATSERDGTLGDSVVAGKETDATESPDTVTLSPALKKESGIENGAISTAQSSDSETDIKQGIIGSSGGSSPATQAPQTKSNDDTKATKGGSEWPPSPTSAPQTKPTSTPTTDDDQSAGDDQSKADSQATKGGSEWTPAPQATPASTPTFGDDQSADDDQSTDASKSTQQWTNAPQSNNQWTPAPNQSNNQQPTQAPNNEEPQPAQPTQAPHREPPQPTQPSQPPHNEPPQPTQPGQNTYWQGNWNGNAAKNGSQNSSGQGSWGAATQTQTTPAPTTTNDPSQESNRDSPVPTEPTYTNAPATTPSPPVSNCKVRRARH